MTRETYTYDFSRVEVFEVGAALLALLAYPAVNDEKHRQNLHASLCASTVRVVFPVDSESRVQPQLIKPIYAFRSEREIAKDLRTIKRRHRQRMIAGRMAVAFLKQAGGIPLNLPASPPRLSINALSDLVAEDAGYADPENVETRIWRQSLPVIHLAAAIQLLLQQAPELHFGHLITNRVWIEWVIRSAAEIEAILAQKRYRGIDPSKLVKIRLAESS